MDILSNIVKLSSISTLNGLTPNQIDALSSIGINRISDLLNYRPINNAKMLMMLVNNKIILDLDKSNLLDKAYKSKELREIPSLSLKSLDGIGDVAYDVFKNNFQITTIEQLAYFKLYKSAEDSVFKIANEFYEPSSAPSELMPRIIGSVESIANYSSFIKEQTLKLQGLELVYDEQRFYVDERLAALFPVQGLSIIRAMSNRKVFPKLNSPIPEFHLGYITKMTQRWINAGTHLGELMHSLPLAPGESRNIAVIDWKRRQSSSKSEDNKVSEQLTNELYHKRALDEVTRSVANEHQQGGTNIAAGTIATAGAGVLGAALAGGVAGSIPGAVIGGVVGAIAGAPTGPADPLVAAAGALGGAVIGFGIGASISGGAALIGAANAQLGTVSSDSKGDRSIVADLSQNITEITSQKSSSVRSLWSTVVATDEQAENERLSTRNVTNYNHSHALTIQYYEVLQHYKTEISLTAAEPILYLPYRPLEFTFDLIADYWNILSRGIKDKKLREEFDIIINGLEHEEVTGPLKLEKLTVEFERNNAQLNSYLNPFRITVSLIGIREQKDTFNNHVNFNFKDPIDATLLKGIQLLGLIPYESIRIAITAKLIAEDNRRNIRSLHSYVNTATHTGTVDFQFNLRPTEELTEHLIQRRSEELVRYFNTHRYFFTRLLLLSIEKEQLIDLIESLMLRPSIQVNFPGISKDPTINNSAISFATRNRSYANALFDSTIDSISSVFNDKISKDSNTRIDSNEKLKLFDEIRRDFRKTIEKNILEKPKTPNDRKKIIDAVEAATNKLSGISTLTKKDKETLLNNIKNLFDKAFDHLDQINFADNIHLSEFIDTTPLAITGNTIIFKMKKIIDPDVLSNNLIISHAQVNRMQQYPKEISDFATQLIADKLNNTRSSDIYLPTSGVFAEAILGRSNASEKIDLTRFFNWQDSPIPHLAPFINALSAGTRKSDPLPTESTVPSNVLNIVNPTAFPEPTGLSGILNAIQNGNIFRDMSKSEQLVTVMSNLSNLAQSMAQHAGTLAGNAQVEALKAATEIGKQVAQLASQVSSQPANLPLTTTEKGAAANILDQLKASPNPLPLDNEIKRVIGVPTPTPSTRENTPTVRPTTPTPSTVSTPEEPLPEGDVIETIEVKLRIFSQKPAELVVPFAPLGGQNLFFAFIGDNRDFSYDQGKSRLELTIELLVNVTYMEIIGTPEITKIAGLRGLYEVGDFELLPNAGTGNIPGWAGRVKPNKTPKKLTEVFDEKAKVEAIPFKKSSNNDEVNIKLSISANLFNPPLNVPPFIPHSDEVTSAMDFLFHTAVADINVSLKRDMADRLKCLISGAHSGFPAYEVYINKIQAYKWDAIAEGKDNRAFSNPLLEKIELNQSFLVPRTRF